jgi:curved DNA-binding protein CbpA
MSKTLDPYKILGVSYSDDIETIRKRFKIMALKTHPDRGGNPKVFDIIKKAYSVIYNYRKKENEQLKKEERQYDVYVDDRKKQSKKLKKSFKKMKPIKVSNKNFDLKHFNRLFSEFKPNDDPDERGYEVEKTDERLDYDEINRRYKKEDKKMEIKIFEEPEPVELTTENYKKLGITKVDTFSKKNSGKKMNYMDYREAYVQHDDITTMGNIREKEYKNMDDIKRDRSNISYDMTPEQRVEYETRLQREKQMEERRKFTVHQKDVENERIFNRMQNFIEFR